MKIRFILALLIIPVFSFGQGSIMQTKSVIIKAFSTNKAASILEQNDSLLSVSVKKGGSAIRYAYQFDHAGKCITETVSSTCEACIDKELKSILAAGKYQWKKINENQYVSRFEDKLIIELPVDKKDKYTILWTDWTRTLYDLLTGNEK